jgi:ribonuclease HI
MELLAIIRALERARASRGALEVLSDSTYVLRGITQWIWGWMRRDWKTAEGDEVKNRDLWQALSAEVNYRRSMGDPAIRWSYVRGHTGVPGNERVDEIAVAFAKRTPLPRPLFSGPLLKYFIPIHDLPEARTIPENTRSAAPRAQPEAALAYLSLVDGVAARHSTWKDCEARVKGRTGAKFKKVTNPEEERKIWESWGVKSPPTPS